MFTRHSNIIEFTPLSKLNKNNNKQQCNIYVGVVSASCNPDTFKAYSIATVDELNANPDLMPITENFFDSHSTICTSNSMNLAAFIVVDSRMISKQNSNPNSRKFGTMTFIKTGKNLGKVNATNAFTQALAEATSLWNKKNDDWGSHRIEPMLAKGTGYDADEITKYIEDLIAKHPKFAIQYKLDGERVIADVNEVYSRNKKDVSVLPSMRAAINEAVTELNKTSNCKFLLDGEFYVHGLSLTEIQGLVSTSKECSQGLNKEMLEYHVFDVIPLNNAGKILPLTYEQRLEKLATINNNKHIKVLPTLLLSCSAEKLVKTYKQALKDGYEGLMFKPLNAVYASGSKTAVMKIKPVIRDEFELVGFQEGRGKNAGMIVYEAKLCAKSIENAIEHFTELGKTYNTEFDPNATFTFVPKFPGQKIQAHKDELIKMRRIEANGKTYFDNHAAGKLYTVEFLDYSLDLKPLRLKGIGFREPLA